jgi:hypothetical protein
MQMYLWPTGSAGSFTVNNPLSVKGTYNLVPASFGPKTYPQITSNLVLMQDTNASTYHGCGAIQDPNSLAGKIAVVDRTTTCTFPQIVYNAQNRGAVALIVIQSSSYPYATTMTGSGAGITIPSFMVSYTDGNKLKQKLLDSSINVLIYANTGDTLDGDLDNGVIIHESGHGVSIRLTGGPANSNCLNNAEQAGEGWSDFFALAFTSKPTDNGGQGRGMATFVVNQPVTGVGIRSYQYSRDMNINPLTYSDVSTYTLQYGYAEPHAIGTVWTSVLWDMYWNLIDKYGFSTNLYTGTGGNNKAIQLVVDGLKLQPCSPGFLDSRDAILLADSMDFGGANKSLIWHTFARRGMGYSASQGSSSSATDQVVAFDLPPQIAGISNAAATSEGIRLAPNPSSGVVYILLPTALEKAEIAVLDVTGKTVAGGPMQADALNRIQLDLGNLTGGVYFISVTTGDHLFRTKLLLAK